LAVRVLPSAEALAVRTDLPYAEAKSKLLSAFEFQYLRDLFSRCDGNISAASRESGIDRKHLRSLLRRNDIIPGE
jgi:DNA-binding NtrC family response regulator